MPYRDWIEPLEPRALLSATTAPITTPTITAVKKGILAVQGTDYGNTFQIRAKDGVITIVDLSTRPATSGGSGGTSFGEAAGSFSGGTLFGSINLPTGSDGTVAPAAMVPVSILQRYRSASVRAIIVIGGAGTDTLLLDQTTLNLVQAHGIESRSLALSPKPRATVVGEPAAYPLLGTYAGSGKVWLQKSTGQIAAETIAKKNAGVIFLGDSMIQRFQSIGAAAFVARFGKYRPLDLGLNGDTTSQLLYRIESQGLLDGVSARYVVLEIGTNNITQTDNPASVYQGVSAVIAQIRQRIKGANILISGILPRRSSADNRVVNKVNDRLATLANGRSIRFLTVGPSFPVSQAATLYYSPTDIHLSATGYAVWVDLIAPVLKDMIG